MFKVATTKLRSTWESLPDSSLWQTLNLQIVKNQSLKPYNTFGLDESCAWFVAVSTLEELHDALLLAKKENLPVLILGGGSNMLITKKFEGLVIKISNSGKEAVELTKSEVTLKVAAGENWHSLVLFTLDQGWYGLENLSLIPGNVGAAPMQNIGAYGAEARNSIVEVEYWDRDAEELKTLSAEECRFGYRESIFKHELKERAVIWSVTFRLSLFPTIKADYGDIRKLLTDWGIQDPEPRDVSRAVIKIRQSKLPDPAELGNAGSFFKNPVVEMLVYETIKKSYPEVPLYVVDATHVKIPAGWLIETAGWKGKDLGSHGVHKKQALVLVNYGNAKGNEILALSKAIQADVKDKFGISLQAEVNVI